MKPKFYETNRDEHSGLVRCNRADVLAALRAVADDDGTVSVCYLPDLARALGFPVQPFIGAFHRLEKVGALVDITPPGITGQFSVYALIGGALFEDSRREVGRQLRRIQRRAKR